MAEAMESIPERKLTARDLELAKVLRGRDIGLRICDAVKVVGGICALYLPLWGIRALAEVLAGKETIVTVNVVFGLSVVLSASISGLGAWWMCRRKMKEQSAELERLRTRSVALEKERDKLAVELVSIRGRAKK
ncbi:MAG: hypothetical protein L6R28_07230 [Planctomycetes bacterium]|nr:hypothetical protein [Planctomycetota bacterium]